MYLVLEEPPILSKKTIFLVPHLSINFLGNRILWLLFYSEYRFLRYDNWGSHCFHVQAVLASFLSSHLSGY